MTIKKLEGHESAQARILTLDDGMIVLKSYSTWVITVSKDGWMRVSGLYSATTIKHIGWFMKELYGLTYQHAKHAFENHYLFNVVTGEIKEMV